MSSLGYHHTENAKRRIGESSAIRQYNTKQIEYFVNENGCHICTSHCRDKGGYPQIRHNKKVVHLSRVIYEQNSKKPIPEGMNVCHSCDTPPCINFGHFFLGTDADNTRDRDQKGRGVIFKGEEHANAKLTEADILAIRTDNDSQRKIATKHGISQRTVLRIKHRTTWKHVA